MNPVLRVSRRAADRLRGGHLWVYRTDVESASEEPEAGALVTVADGRGMALGSALYSASSQIAARVVSAKPDVGRREYLEDLRVRVGAALTLRVELARQEPARRLAEVMPSPYAQESGVGFFHGSNAGRLLFSEADAVPGIVADRYNDLVLLQLLTQGTAQNDVRAVVASALRDLTPKDKPLTIWERPDPRIRELEQLPLPSEKALFSTHDEAPTTTTFLLNFLQFQYDAAAGQKTGAFLDQRLNYAAAAAQVQASGRVGRALDVCTYQGGFALHLARVCAHVTGIDASRAALEAADRNLELNQEQIKAEVEWIEADAFEYLRHLDQQARTVETTFDAIVLDPPAFAKSRRAAEGALRGYKELNLRAMRLLAKGGTLVTNSCSHHVSLEDFTAVVAAATADAGRRVQLLETRAAAPDHPEVLTLPETRYLKCLICRVD